MLVAVFVSLVLGLATPAWAQDPPPAPPPAAEAELPPPLRQRVRDLLGPLENLSPEERAERLRALLASGTEPPPVRAALQRALTASEAGAPFDGVMRVAVGDAPPRPPAARPADGPGLAVPAGGGLSAERLQAIRSYRARHLEVRGETRYEGGGATVVSTGYGRRWWGVGMTEVYTHPVTATPVWAVYQGPERLTVPRFYDLAGEAGRADALRDRISGKKTMANVWFGVAGAGIATSLVGFFGYAGADDARTAQTWGRVALGGMGVGVVGLVGGSFPSTKARQLAHDYPTSLDPQEAHRLVDAANERLRRELGLTPEEALRAEGGERGPR